MSEKQFTQRDCPICRGDGYNHPPPFYKTKKCNHKAEQRYLADLIKRDIKLEKEAKLALLDIQAKLQENRRIFNKYFVDATIGRQSTIEDFGA